MSQKVRFYKTSWTKGVWQAFFQDKVYELHKKVSGWYVRGNGIPDTYMGRTVEEGKRAASKFIEEGLFNPLPHTEVEDASEHSN